MMTTSMKATRLAATLAAFAASVLGSIAVPTHAVAANDGISRLIAVTQMKADNANNGALKGPQSIRRPVVNTGVTGPKAGGVKATALTSGDCWATNGKIVTVADDRCGASRQYCKYGDGNAVCIDKAN